MELGLSLGTNLGDRLANLILARSAIGALPGTRLTTQAPVYETDPVDVAAPYRDQPFLNTILIIESTAPVEQLAEQTHTIEYALGRRRQADRNAPRPIDIDLIYAGDQILDTGSLVVPHPRWASRRFVVEPLAAVRPHLQIPGMHQTVAELLLTLPPTPNVVLYKAQW